MSSVPPSGRMPHVTIEEELRSSYLDYAMSVIIGRALPDVRDGLKPVHRRVLYAMHEQRNVWNQPYKKSARIVGDVIGKYHPHGDAAVYDTIVRMAQDFSMRYPLVDGQGNFGSVDGDPPAAMRYTEVRMTRLAGEMLADIDKDTVDFAPNYDGSTQEPTVLPARVPNLLINGSAGIAVGMSTNIPPHNLREVVDATIALIRNPDLSVDELMTYVQGPDFPTGAFIYGRKGIHSAYHTGRGVIRMRAVVDVEQVGKGREAIVITELPYQVNKAKLVEKIAQLVKDKRIDGISAIRDESDREGMRVVIELRKDAIAQVVINQLYTSTPMQSSFGIINLAIVHGRPRVLNLRELLVAFIDHRRDVVTRRCVFELRKAEERAHLLEGYKIALDNIDEVVQIIKSSKAPPEARTRLMDRFGFSERQAQAILDLRLHRLTGLERDKILEELRETLALIERLKAILANEQLLMQVIVDELTEIRNQYGDERRTRIVDDTGEMRIEDLIAPEDVVVFVTHSGYVKRMPASTWRRQHRGGKGKRGSSTKEEDFVVEVFVANTHTDLLIFTDRGKVYPLKVYELPEGSRSSRGRPIINLIRIAKGERVRAVLPVSAWDDGSAVVFATRRGLVKKTRLEQFRKVLSKGIAAIKLQPSDDLVSVRLVRDDDDILLATADGQSIRFAASDIRPMGRATRGVKGIALRPGDEVVGMEILRDEATILTVTENGYGKRTPASDYRVQSRGGLGIITIKTRGRNGRVVAIAQVTDDDDVIIVTDKGQLIRCPVSDISVLGRNTMGVRLINLADGERVVAVERVAEGDEAQGANGS